MPGRLRLNFTDVKLYKIKGIIKVSRNKTGNQTSRKKLKMIRLKTFAEGIFVQEQDDFDYDGFNMNPKKKEKVKPTIF